MTSAEKDIKDAIETGTLDDNASVAELLRRRHNFEADGELMPDIHDRGLVVFDTAITKDAAKAVKSGIPLVSTLRRVLIGIGALYRENERRLAESVPDSKSTAKHEPEAKDATPSGQTDKEDEKTREQPQEMEKEATESTEILDYDESDDLVEEEHESESDYGKPYKGKGKRKAGRPKTKHTEEARVATAIKARQNRKRLNHGTPDGDAKNPRRRLFGPSSELGDFSGMNSPSPSVSAAKSKMKKTNPAMSLHSSTSGKMACRRLSMQADDTPSKQPVNLPPSLHNSANPTVRPSLIVKLKIQVQFAPNPVLKSAPKHRRPRKLKTEYKSAIVVNSDSESDGMREYASPGSADKMKRLKNKATSKRAALVPSSDEKGGSDEEEEVDIESEVPEVTSKNGKTRVTRQQRGGLAAHAKQSSTTSKMRQDTSAPQQPESLVSKTFNTAPTAPQSQQYTTPRTRRGAISSPTALTAPSPQDKSPSPTNKIPSDDNLIPNPPPPPSHRPFAPFPPFSPRCLSPFTRGARIALENILADHHSEPSVSLLGLIDELDDTRPIVNDWEHVTVMKGGSWVYQVMRDVLDEAAEDEEDDDEMDGDVDVDIEDVVGKVGGWIDREVGRLRGGG